MTQALLLGVLCAGIYGLFLFIRGLARLWAQGQKKMFAFCLSAYGLGCLALLACLFVKLEDLDIWILLPAMLLIFLLFSAGYFLESYLRELQRLKKQGLQRQTPQRKKYSLLIDLLMLFTALLIWCLGFFVGYDSNQTVEIILLCICMFLLARSVTSLWKYRGF